jgi:alanyl-tRNA synthetase
LVPSAPLLPENDPTALFISAGMQPLVPYLLGERHPAGRRLVSVQRCLRTNDIEEVGDASHLTFFEMLGNWSLGDYFKAESLAWSFEFLTQVLGLPAERLEVTVFAGDAQTPRDDESAGHWRRLGMPVDRIHYLPKSDNWWGRWAAADRADLTRRSSSTPAGPIIPAAGLAARAASGSKSGTTYSWSFHERAVCCEIRPVG